jgi:hypothetical protein
MKSAKDRNKVTGKGWRAKMQSRLAERIRDYEKTNAETKSPEKYTKPGSMKKD